MLKKLWAFIILAVMFSACSFFGSEKPQHMMWEVRTPKSTVFLVGSIHIGDTTLYPLENIYYEKLDSSDIFVTEVDMEDIDPTKIIKLVMLSDGTTLKDHVPEDVYKIIKDKFAKANVPEMAFQQFKPGFAILMTQMLDLKDNPADIGSMPEGIDKHLLARAKTQDKLALEDIATQIDLLENIINVDSTKMRLYLESETEDDMFGDINNLMQAWKDADTDKIVEIINKSTEIDEDFAKLKEEILDNRNKNMADKIDSYLVDGGKFYVVVGAAHLCGEGSIVDLLEKMGYTVKQL